MNIVCGMCLLMTGSPGWEKGISNRFCKFGITSGRDSPLPTTIFFPLPIFPFPTTSTPVNPAVPQAVMMSRTVTVALCSHPQKMSPGCLFQQSARDPFLLQRSKLSIEKAINWRAGSRHLLIARQARLRALRVCAEEDKGANEGRGFQGRLW